MPDRYVNNHLELEKFLSMNVMGDLYTGFVTDTGYAFVVDIPPLQSSGEDKFYIPFKAQALDTSEEARVRSLNLTDETLKEKIIQRNNDGTYSINVCGENMKLDSPDDVQVHIHDDGTNLLVDLTIKKTSIQLEQITQSTFSTTIKLTEAPIYFSVPPEKLSTGDYLEGASRGLSSVGVPVGYLREMWGIENTKFTNPQKAQHYAYELSKSLKHNNIDIKTSKLKKEIIPKGLKTLNRGLTLGGRGLVFADMYCSGQLKVSHLVSLYMLSAAFPVSWVIGGIIIAADILLECTTDKGMGDWIDYYAGKIGIGDENGVLIGGNRRFIPNHRDFNNNGELIFEPDKLRVVRPLIFDRHENR